MPVPEEGVLPAEVAAAGEGEEREGGAFGHHDGPSSSSSFSPPSVFRSPSLNGARFVRGKRRRRGEQSVFFFPLLLLLFNPPIPPSVAATALFSSALEESASGGGGGGITTRCKGAHLPGILSWSL